MSIEFEVNQNYIERLGAEFTDSHGQCNNGDARDFVEKIHEDVFQTPVMEEFQSGWRNMANIEVKEDVAGDFVSACVHRYMADNMEREDLRKLIQPLQIPAAKKYRDDHIEALQDAPIQYRQRYAEYLTPLIKICQSSLTAENILELLFEGLISNNNIKPHSDTSNSSEHIIDPLEQEIINNDEIDLDNEYFYQGPRHLGIFKTHKERGIASCVCQIEQGQIFPFFLSNEDPINKPVQEFLNELIEEG